MSYSPGPFSAASKGISVSSTDTALTAVALPVGTDTTTAGNSVRVVNEGPNVCFVALGTSAVVATLPTTGGGVATCTPVLAGTDIILTRSPLVDRYISTICRSTGTSVLTVQVGEGQ